MLFKDPTIITYSIYYGTWFESTFKGHYNIRNKKSKVIDLTHALAVLAVL